MSTYATAKYIWDDEDSHPGPPDGRRHRDCSRARLHQHDRQRASRGNLDVQEMGPGCRVFLPIAAEGAYFYLGDCHAVQGDGELCGIGAIEIRTQTTVRLDLVKKPARMVWPRIETDEHIGAVACARPLEDAFRLATEELVNWMVDDYGFSPEGAVLLLGQVAEARCTQLANPKYTYITKIAKGYL